MNDLKLRFGPAPSNPRDAVGINFISSPQLQPDFAVSLLETFRFAKENIDNIRDYLLANSFLTKRIRVRVYNNGTNLLSTTANLGTWDLVDSSRSFDCEDGTYSITELNSQIKISGIKQTKSGSWGVGIKPGLVYRTYTIPEYEQNDIWWRQVPTLSGTGAIGTQALFIYTVPEVTYAPRYTIDKDDFPGSTVKYNIVTDKGVAVGPNKISYVGRIDKLKELKINGLVVFTESSPVSGFVKSINQDLNTIDIRNTIDASDDIELTFYTYSEEYLYLGYYDDFKYDYFPLDLNPEYGHYSGDDRTRTLRPTSECLLEQITIYGIPTAVATFKIENASDGSGLPTLTISFYSGYTYGTSHFIRHTVGLQTEEITPILSEGPPNTYGFSLFGRNYYDEPSVSKSDIFSKTYPSMLPLGRVLLRAPLDTETVQKADIRIRGGGIPDYFNLDQLVGEPGVIRSIKGYFDIGNWDGQSVQKGGVIDVKISPSVLKSNGGKFVEAEVDEIVRQRMLPGIKYKISYEEIA